MRRTIFLAVATGIAVGAIFSGLLVSGVLSQDGPELSPGQAFYQRATVEQATAEAGPHAPKLDPLPTRPPTPTSCPVDIRTLHLGVFDAYTFQPLREFRTTHADKTFVRVAGAIGSNGLYGIYSGNLKSDPSQAFMLVYRGAKDPCAEGRERYEPQLYLTPFKKGAATLLAVEGDRVTFRTTDGTLGRFDFTTGEFR